MILNASQRAGFTVVLSPCFCQRAQRRKFVERTQFHAACPLTPSRRIGLAPIFCSIERVSSLEMGQIKTFLDDFEWIVMLLKVPERRAKKLRTMRQALLIFRLLLPGHDDRCCILIPCSSPKLVTPGICAAAAAVRKDWPSIAAVLLK